jgi:hypothetical protein
LDPIASNRHGTRRAHYLDDFGRSEAPGQALADLNILVRTGGPERAVAEHDAWLGAAALAIRSVEPTGAPSSIVEVVVDGAPDNAPALRVRRRML